jgi:hypothetical protein
LTVILNIQKEGIFNTKNIVGKRFGGDPEKRNLMVNNSTKDGSYIRNCFIKRCPDDMSESLFEIPADGSNDNEVEWVCNNSLL